MDLKELQKPLPIESIDFRIQSINKGGYATILAYKDARVDMNRLNEVCGVLGWQRQHTRDNKNCIVSIWDNENKQWVHKEDTGSESNAEAQKGLASDSFKRACFNLGIGIELYDYPVISIKLKANEFKVENNKAKPTWDLKLKEWKWSSEFENGKLIKLSCIDNLGSTRFNFDATKEQQPKETPKKWLSEKQAQTIINEGIEKTKKAIAFYDNKTVRDGYIYCMSDAMKKMLETSLTLNK